MSSIVVGRSDGTLTLNGLALVGDVTGNVTGDVSGSAATVTGGTQAAITTLDNLTGYQVSDADLTAIAALAHTDGNFIVGDGAAWVAESGATARTSLGLGTTDSATFNALSVNASDIRIQENDPYYRTLRFNSAITANRSLIFTLGNATRTITMTGDPTLSDWFDQSVKTTAPVTFDSVTLGADKKLSWPGGSYLETTNSGDKMHVYAPDITLEASGQGITLDADEYIKFKSGNNTTDYIAMLTQASLPEILSIGTCDLKLSNDLGDSVLVSDLDDHLASTSNPHTVTADQLTLGTDDSPEFTGLTLTGNAEIDGTVGIGVAPASGYGLNIVETITDNHLGARVALAFSPAAADKGATAFGYAVNISGASDNVAFLTGVNGQVNHPNNALYTGTCASLAAVKARIMWGGNMSVTDPTLTDGYLFQGLSFTNGAGPLTNNNIVNAYGLYLPDISVGNILNYAIYSVSGDVYFGGDSLVMPNIPTADPEVVGALWSNSGIVTVSAGA